jgi:PPK2 family polyphosphate:nucleotide phosphotransferase
VAKPGGKADKKRKDKRAAKDQGKVRVQSGKRGADKATKVKDVKAKALKPAKAKRVKGAQRLVEQVAAEIVMAEFDRAVSEAAREGAPVTQAVVLEAGAAETGVVESSVVESGVVESATEGESSAAEAGVVDKPAATTAVAQVHEGPGDEPQQADDADESDADSYTASFGDLLRIAPGPVDLDAIDTASTPGAVSRERAEAQLPKLAARLEELQERLFAAARGGQSKSRVLLVLQGMDTSGKGGTVRHVVGQLDPNGTRLTAFKAPTEEERAHDFLWRIRNALPVAGEVGIFDRSHYEDVLIARVRKLALPMVIGKRYQLINRFEQNLAADGAVVVKCFLHISAQEQKERLLARLDDPRKLWKYNPGDVDERLLWPQYQEAYRLALEKCNTEAAPWHVVPADRKWYRNYAITRLLVEALERIDPQYPAGGFDVDVERKRVLAS